MDGIDVDLLMKVQYEFPLVEKPFQELGRQLGLDEEEVIGRLRALAEAGVLRRIGSVMNYRARGLEAALVGFAVPDKLIDEVAAEINKDPMVTHNYLRDYKPYNVWFVTKADTAEELEEKVKKLADRWGLDYVVLYSLRTYKLDVRFDLYEGISRSKSGVLPESPPSADSLGIPKEFYSKVRSIPLVAEPFREAARALGKSVGETLDVLQELIRLGVLRDFHASLDGEKLGFRENAMVVLKKPDCEKAAALTESTHVVLRNTVPGKWEYPCYFMVHARSKDVIVKRVSTYFGADYNLLFSVRDLLGGGIMARRIESVSD
ncbi:MAG: Lrp/AsnC family transcriptional regulator [Thermoproteus sp.]